MICIPCVGRRVHTDPDYMLQVCRRGRSGTPARSHIRHIRLGTLSALLAHVDPARPCFCRRVAVVIYSALVQSHQSTSRVASAPCVQRACLPRPRTAGGSRAHSSFSYRGRAGGRVSAHLSPRTVSRARRRTSHVRRRLRCSSVTVYNGYILGPSPVPPHLPRW